MFILFCRRALPIGLRQSSTQRIALNHHSISTPLSNRHSSAVVESYVCGQGEWRNYTDCNLNRTFPAFSLLAAVAMNLKREEEENEAETPCKKERKSTRRENEDAADLFYFVERTAQKVADVRKKLKIEFSAIDCNVQMVLLNCIQKLLNSSMEKSNTRALKLSLSINASLYISPDKLELVINKCKLMMESASHNSINFEGPENL